MVGPAIKPIGDAAPVGFCWRPETTIAELRVALQTIRDEDFPLIIAALGEERNRLERAIDEKRRTIVETRRRLPGDLEEQVRWVDRIRDIKAQWRLIDQHRAQRRRVIRMERAAAEQARQQARHDEKVATMARVAAEIEAARVAKDERGRLCRPGDKRTASPRLERKWTRAGRLNHHFIDVAKERLEREVFDAMIAEARLRTEAESGGDGEEK